MDDVETGISAGAHMERAKEGRIQGRHGAMDMATVCVERENKSELASPDKDLSFKRTAVQRTRPLPFLDHSLSCSIPPI